MKALLDTNILIDHLNGVPQARAEIGRYPAKAISIISWMEVLIGAPPEAAAGTRAFLAGFDLIGLDANIAEAAVTLRQAGGLKLPDAIILATAQVHSLLLVTRDARAFSADDPGVRIPYRL